MKTAIFLLLVALLGLAYFMQQPLKSAEFRKQHEHLQKEIDSIKRSLVIVNLQLDTLKSGQAEIKRELDTIKSGIRAVYDREENDNNGFFEAIEFYLN